MSSVQQTSNTAEAEQIDVPEGIISFLQRRNGIIIPSVKSRYWVSNIVACQRKTYYRELGIEEEELLKDATLEAMWDTVRGDFLHQMTYAYKWRELDIERCISLKDGRTAVLVGRLDMYDWRAKTIIDLKTTKFIKWQIKQGFIPRLEHILQIQCYETIFSNLLPIESLKIVYADMSDIIAYKIQKRDLTEWIKRRIQEIENSLTDTKVPIGEVSGACKYCRFQTRCCNDSNGLTDKPLSIPKTAHTIKSRVL
ncbi:MAG TPA: PD-(D/E)XK nuclease family protein [Nitrososphaeraceae archaeon]|jgi:CRISPR/Cas system-associated exonuclease Cas4 (RecB family)